MCNNIRQCNAQVLKLLVLIEYNIPKSVLLLNQIYLRRNIYAELQRKLIYLQNVRIKSLTDNKIVHLGGTTWLDRNYFGEQGLVCLCNPAKVVSVPYQDDYGKLRTCEYLPIALAEYDEYGKVIPYNVDDGFDSKYIKTVLYSGDVATEELPTYQINIPEIPEVNKSVISKAVYNIAKEFINK